MTVSRHSQTFHEVLYKLSDPEEKRSGSEILQAYDYDPDEYKNELEKYRSELKSGEFNPENAWGMQSSFFQTPSVPARIVSSTVGKLGKGLYGLAEWGADELGKEDEFNQLMDTFSGALSKDQKKFLVDTFDPYHGDGLGGALTDVTSDLATIFVPIGAASKASKDRGFGETGKRLARYLGYGGSSLIWSGQEQLDENLLNILADSPFVQDNDTLDSMGRLFGIDNASRKLGDSMRIDSNDPSAKSKQIISNLGLEVLLGGGIHAAGKVKNSKTMNSFWSLFGAQRGTDQAMLDLAVERSQAAGAALTKVRGFNEPLLKELKRNNLYNDDYLENVVNKALGGVDDTLPRARQLQERDSALQQLTLDSPEAADIVTDMRNAVDDLSRYVGDTVVKDVNLKAKINSNIGTYLNRSYRAFDDKANYKLKDVPENVKQRAADYLMQNEGIPAEAIPGVLKQLVEGESAGKVDRLFKAWGQLGGSTSSVIKTRKEIPKEIKDLWGPVNDPFKNFSNTIEKLSSIETGFTYLNKVKQHMLAQGIAHVGKGTKMRADAPSLGQAVKDRMDGIAKGVNSGKFINPLEGLYGDKHYQSFIREGLDTSGFFGNNPGNVVRAFLKAKTASQISKTVLSPATHGRNMFGNMVIMTANGFLAGPKSWKNGLEVISRKFINVPSKEVAEHIAKYQRYGIVDSGISQNLLRRTAADALKHGTPTSWMDKIYKRSGGEAAFKLYQAEDDIWKIMHFEKTLNYLKKAYKNRYSDVELEQMAARRTRDLMPNYNLIPKAFKKLRGAPVGDFLAFPAEMTRISKNLIKYTMQDITSGNVRLSAEGMKKLAGLHLAGLGGQMAQDYSANLFGISEAEQEALKVAYPHYAKTSNKIFTGPIEYGPNGDVRIKAIDQNALDPFAYLTEPLNITSNLVDNWIMSGETPTSDDFTKYGLRILDKTMGPYLGTSMITDGIIDIMENKADPTTPIGIRDLIANSGVITGRVFEPGLLKFIRDRKAYENQKALHLTGSPNITFDTYFADPEGLPVVDKYGNALPTTDNNFLTKMLGNKSYSITGPSMKRNIEMQIGQINRTSQRVKNVMRNYHNYSDEDISNAYLDSQEQKLSYLKKFQKDIENYKFLLGDKLEHLLDRSLTNRFSLGKKMPKDTARTISDVLNNRFRPSDFQSSLIEGARVMPGKIGSLQSAWPRLQEIYRTLQNTNIRPE